MYTETLNSTNFSAKKNNLSFSDIKAQNVMPNKKIYDFTGWQC